MHNRGIFAIFILVTHPFTGVAKLFGSNCQFSFIKGTVILGIVRMGANLLMKDKSSLFTVDQFGGKKILSSKCL